MPVANKIEYLMTERARALASGDMALVRSWDADLARHGVFPERGEALVTTQAAALPERAVPPKPKRGRPPRHREQGETA